MSSSGVLSAYEVGTRITNNHVSESVTIHVSSSRDRGREVLVITDAIPLIKDGAIGTREKERGTGSDHAIHDVAGATDDDVIVAIGVCISGVRNAGTEKVVLI